MKILYLTHYFPPEGNAPASRVYETCKRWARAGHCVTVITCIPNCPTGVVYPGYRNRLCQREIIDGIEVWRVWTYIAANRGTFRRIINYLSYMVSAVIMAMAVRRPDVLIATSPQFFCGWAGAIVGKLRRLPFILEIRDIWPESIAAVGAFRKRSLIRGLEVIERVMYHSATHIVTVGDGYRSQLIARKVSVDRITVIPNGVDKELFTPRKADIGLRQHYGLGSEFICAYIGTIGMASGLNVVLQAAELLRNNSCKHIKFMLVGDGAVREALEARSRELGLDNVVFTGRQDRSVIPIFLATVNACLVHLRPQELFKSVLPSKIFEAAAMGKPIILGLEGYAAAIIRGANAGLVIEPGSAEQLAVAVQRLAKDPELCEQLGRAGQRHVMEHYDREVLTQRYLEVVHRVRNSSRTRSTETVASEAGGTPARAVTKTQGGTLLQPKHGRTPSAAAVSA